MFKGRDLNVLAYANGFTWWHYRTEDTIDEVLNQEGYWDKADDMVKEGDHLCINTLDANTTGFITLRMGRITIS
jgi:hypothetical protein|tara:strand:+ start:742 stop:963 length:222 start_codon:yes stop_codon:yes gene_type:complete